MDWIEDNTPASLRLVVRNHDDTPHEVTVACRSDGEVIFRDTIQVDPDDTYEWPDPFGATTFELGVQLDDGPTTSEPIDTTTGDTITTTLTPDGITFNTTTTANTTPPESDTGTADTGASATQELGPGEVYCRSCGTTIKQRAELCPNCGVRNAAYDPTAGTQQTNTAQGSQNQRGAQSRESTTTTQSEPSGSWVTGVKVGGALWGLALLLLIPLTLMFTGGAGAGVAQGLHSLGLAALLTPVQLLAWVILPIALYKDLKYIDYHTDSWPLNGRLYIAAVIILPLFTQLLGATAILLTGPLSTLLAAIIPITLIALTRRHITTRTKTLPT